MEATAAWLTSGAPFWRPGSSAQCQGPTAWRHTLMSSVSAMTLSLFLWFSSLFSVGGVSSRWLGGGEVYSLAFSQTCCQSSNVFYLIAGSHRCSNTHLVYCQTLTKRSISFSHQRGYNRGMAVSLVIIYIYGQSCKDFLQGAEIYFVFAQNEQVFRTANKNAYMAGIKTSLVSVLNMYPAILIIFFIFFISLDVLLPTIYRKELNLFAVQFIILTVSVK